MEAKHVTKIDPVMNLPKKDDSIEEKEENVRSQLKSQ